MALNTIHKNPKDIVSVLNVTKNKYFKCELVEDVQSERIRVALGLDLPSTKLTLKINGHGDVSINEKDTIKVLNDTFIVSKIAERYDNSLQFRKRADYSYFNGTSYIFLE